MAKSMPLPHNADIWWDEEDSTVGTGCDWYNYLHSSRVILQLEIVSQALCPNCGAGGNEPPLKRYGRKCGGCKKKLGSKDAVDRIADVRCWIEDDEFNNDEEAKQLSIHVSGLLIGLGLAEAVAIPFEKGVCALTIRDALHAALKDWARKFGGRESRLPALLKPVPQRYSKFVKRILSHLYH